MPHITLGNLFGHPADQVNEFRNALFGNGGDLHHGYVGQKGIRQVFGNIVPHQLQPVGIHHIHLGEDHQPVFNLQKRTNLQMLPGLWHDALIRRNDQCHQVDSRRAGHHILDEFLVTRYINNPQSPSIGQAQVSETQLNGDTPLLFFFQTIRINTGKCSDQRCLPVINVAGRAENNLFHETILKF